MKTYQQARAAWQQDRAEHEARGVHLPTVRAYLPSDWKANAQLAQDELDRMAMDMMPQFGIGHNGGPSMAFDAPLLTTDPNSAVPALLTKIGRAHV